MKLKEVLNQIHAPKGITYVISGISVNDFSVLPHQKGLYATIEMADEQIKKYQKQIDSCKSDWSYWSILGDLEYWKSIRDILEAASIVGEDNLPDIHYEKKNLVVMDEIAEVRKYGEIVLELARKTVL